MVFESHVCSTNVICSRRQGSESAQEERTEELAEHNKVVAAMQQRAQCVVEEVAQLRHELQVERALNEEMTTILDHLRAGGDDAA